MDALRRAHVEQKLKGMQPATQQAIIEIVIHAWLKDNGFLELASDSSIPNCETLRQCPRANRLKS